MDTSLLSYKNILKVAIPIIIGGIAQNIVSVTDTVFLSKLGQTQLGAAGNAGIFYFFTAMIGLGLITGSQILMGNYNGAQKFTKVGTIFNTSLIIACLLGFFLLAFISLGGNFIFRQLTKEPDIQIFAQQFLSIRAWGIIFAQINFVFIAFYVAITKTRIISVITIFMSLINVILDYGLIFGNLGLPQMGVKGAALASVIAEIIAFLGFLLTLKKSHIHQFALFKQFKIYLTEIKEIVNMGFPVLLQYLLSIGSWLAFFMFIEKLGKPQLASAHIVRSIYMVLMIPLFGFSNTTNTLVSNLFGAQKQQLVPLLLKRIILLCLAATLASFIVIFFFPDAILSIFTNNTLLTELSKQSLIVIGFTMFLFSISFILFNAILGAGKTKWALFIEFSTIIIYLITVYLITIIYPQPLHIVWAAEFVYFSILGLLSYIILSRFILKPA